MSKSHVKTMINVIGESCDFEPYLGSPSEQFQSVRCLRGTAKQLLDQCLSR